MRERLVRAGVALLIALAAGGAGYTLGTEGSAGGAASVAIPAQTVSAPEEGSVRVIYSLDQKQNDKELVALIDGAEEYIYFAIYTFTLHNVADALVAAKKRGVDVRGIVDSEQSRSSYGAPIVAKLRAGGVPLVVEKHASGNGIMHLKLLVTEKVYATGSYNWTKSATLENDEVLEIGTNEKLRQVYENILKRLLDAYRGNAAAGAAASVFHGEQGRTTTGLIDYTQAPEHIGEYASVRGTLVRAYTSASGTVFLDFCKSYKDCPFSGVIFADDAKQFGLSGKGDFSRYEGKLVTLTGKIVLYQGRAEIILSSPTQFSQ